MSLQDIKLFITEITFSFSSSRRLLWEPRMTGRLQTHFTETKSVAVWYLIKALLLKCQTKHCKHIII